MPSLSSEDSEERSGMRGGKGWWSSLGLCLGVRSSS